mmetsp:Transcript_47985/g.94725  ORF Transcript_47985/g.94725 Transcript_47985/m.94725 type:complete len:132 (-) Transcript_47985:1000-1395(-)
MLTTLSIDTLLTPAIPPVKNRLLASLQHDKCTRVICENLSCLKRKQTDVELDVELEESSKLNTSRKFPKEMLCLRSGHADVTALPAERQENFMHSLQFGVASRKSDWNPAAPGHLAPSSRLRGESAQLTGF